MDDALGKLLKGSFADLVKAEDLLLDSMRDLVREEFKRRIREELDANEELKAELREAVRMLLEAKVQEAYAGLRLAKATAKIGLEMLPPGLRDQIGREVMATFEKEMARILEKAL